MLVIRVFLFAISVSINLATISRAESSECARISDLASARSRWAATRGRMLSAAALCIAMPGLVAMLGGSAQAGVTLEERKLPMHFSWVACGPNCRGWISAVGVVTEESPKDFDEFAGGRQLTGDTVVLDSSGGSVNDAIALGRRWRSLGLLTTVGISILDHTAQGDHATVAPRRKPIASRCAFSCCCQVMRATCPRARMSGCIRSGWATAPSMPRPRLTPRRI
jgi:hypothetical protein